MKEMVIELLKKALHNKGVAMNEEEIGRLLEIPPSAEIGDFAFPCFSLSETLKREPHKIALELREKIGTPSVADFENVRVVGPYINFFFNRRVLAKELIEEVLKQKDNFGKINFGMNKKIILGRQILEKIRK